MAPINIDGSPVQDITIDGQPVTEVTVDGDVVFPTLDPDVIDNFEPVLYEDVGNTLSTYYTFSTDGTAQRQTSVVQEGTTALELQADNAGSSQLTSFPGDGLPNYLVAGDDFTYFFNISNANTGNFQDGISLCFGVSAGNNQYRFQYTSQGTFRLIIQDPGFSVLDSSGVILDSNKWYRVDASWGTNGVISGTLKETSGQTITSVSATDTNFTSGGVRYLLETSSQLEGRIDGFRLI